METPAILTIDLNALVRNYKRLQRLSGNAECGAVVKSNAYSLGLEKIATSLYQAGCRTFFVGYAEEGWELRQLLPDARIVLMHGITPDSVELCFRGSLVPVLNCMDEVSLWHDYVTKQNMGKAPAIIHIDTGMNRLGIGPDELPKLIMKQNMLDAFDIHAWMTHLACAPQADNPFNKEQRDRLLDAIKPLPKAPITLSATMGILLGEEYLFDITRPGGGLYGIFPRHMHDEPPFESVVTLEARILQVRNVKKGDPVGYGSTHRCERDSKVATLGTGYYDGYLRSLSNQGYAYVGTHKVPIIGIVSMDLVAIDVTDVPEHLVQKGGFVELMGANHTCVDVAIEAGSHAHQVLTNLSPRYERRYIELEQTNLTAEVA